MARIESRGRIRTFVHTVRTHDGDPLPTTLILIGVLLSVGALSAGVILGWQNLLSNVTANLVILGPGLLVTNYYVKMWRENRLATQMQPEIHLLLAGVDMLGNCAVELNRMMNLSMPVEDWHSFLKESHASEDGRLIATRTALQAMLDSMPRTSSLDNEEKARDLELSRAAAVHVPSMILVERLVDHLDQLRPMPEAHMTATLLRHLYESRYFSTVYTPEYPKDFPMPQTGEDLPGVYAVQQGFADLARYAIECKVPESGTSRLTVLAGQYYDAIRSLLFLTVRMLKQIERALPDGMIISTTHPDDAVT